MQIRRIDPFPVENWGIALIYMERQAADVLPILSDYQFVCNWIPIADDHPSPHMVGLEFDA